MTTIGHSLIGISLGVAALPKRKSFISTALNLFLFVFLANFPDLPVPGWGHDRYYFSHSIFIVTGIALLLVFIYLVLHRFCLKKKPHYGFLVLMVLALYSHLLLDSFYNHGLGVAIFWPISSASLVLPVPWLSVQYEYPPPITSAMLRIWWIEVASFSPFVLIALLWKYFKVK